MEWEEVDPGRKKREIRPREAARRGGGARHFCHWAIAGAPARPRPGPARRGESPAAAAPPHALPRRPRARGRPGQVAAVPGSGRPGAAASERAAGSAGSSSGSDQLALGWRGALSWGRAAPCGSTRPLPPVRPRLVFRLRREGAAPAGGCRARLAAGSFPSRHRGPPRPACGRPAGAEGPRPRVRGEGEPAGGGKGTKAGGGRWGPAGGRGGGAPPRRS